MKYTPPTQPPVENNITDVHPLFDAFRLVGGLLAAFLLVYIVLGTSMDWAVMNITEETEDKYLSSLGKASIPFKKGESSHPREQDLQVMITKLADVIPMNKKETSSYHRTYRLSVYNSDEVNAFALPGGEVIVLSGLIDKAHSDDEIAFVLAHELGHYKSKDHLRGMGRGIVLLSLSILAGGENNPAAPFIVSSLSLKDKQFSRQQESVADSFALRLMQDAGYDPNGGIEFMETLLEDSSKTSIESALEILSTHPASSNRIEDLRNEIKLLD